jgi:hypothetical protein
MTIFGILLVVNTVLAVVFILTVRHPQERIFGLFFLILPGFGLLFYFAPKLWFQVTKKHNLYDVSNVKLKINEETFSQKTQCPQKK